MISILCTMTSGELTEIEETMISSVHTSHGRITSGSTELHQMIVKQKEVVDSLTRLLSHRQMAVKGAWGQDGKPIEMGVKKAKLSEILALLPDTVSIDKEGKETKIRPTKADQIPNFTGWAARVITE